MWGAEKLRYAAAASKLLISGIPPLNSGSPQDETPTCPGTPQVSPTAVQLTVSLPRCAGRRSHSLTLKGSFHVRLLEEESFSALPLKVLSYWHHSNTSA